jgi:hypothetical protein
MGNIFKKSSSLKPVSQFKANMAWMVLRTALTDTILKGDHLRTIDDMFAILAY